jgi:hypothetical protein
MATLTCWIRNNDTGEITETRYVNQLPFFVGNVTLVKESDYIEYVATQKYKGASKGHYGERERSI